MDCKICSRRGCSACGYTGKHIVHVYKESNERYTPRRMIEVVREVLGTIDTDPASSAVANKVVQATTYYTRQQDGLRQQWNGKVFCNPPYGRLPGVNGGYQKLFIDKAVEEYRIGHAEEIILLLLGNIIFTEVGRGLWEYPFCTWEDTVVFYNEQGENCSYGFGVLFLYIGKCSERFRDVFNPYGHVTSGRHVCHLEGMKL